MTTGAYALSFRSKQQYAVLIAGVTLLPPPVLCEVETKWILFDIFDQTTQMFVVNTSGYCFFVFGI